MLIATEMVSRQLSTEEVVALLTSEEEFDLDDPQEVIMEGSDEEFDYLEESENGTVAYSSVF